MAELVGAYAGHTLQSKGIAGLALKKPRIEPLINLFSHLPMACVPEAANPRSDTACELGFVPRILGVGRKALF
jgi:hypothetical protein